MDAGVRLISHGQIMTPLPGRSQSASDTLALPFGPNHTEGEPMGFIFRLELEDGTPTEPPTLATAVPNWRSGDEIPLGWRTLRVVRVRDDDADQPPVLVVEDG